MHYDCALKAAQKQLREIFYADTELSASVCITAVHLVAKGYLIAIILKYYWHVDGDGDSTKDSYINILVGRSGHITFIAFFRTIWLGLGVQSKV